jgi:uracil-DNA glycosylase family 4
MAARNKIGILPETCTAPRRTKIDDESRAGMPELASCRACPRLASYLDGVRQRFRGYHARPVPAFGDPHGRLVVVGLAPGLHGANRTGRPFTGDHAGILLYDTLHRFGFSTAPVSRAPDDGLRLKDCLITNAVKCAPPHNAPQPDEVRRCNAYLGDEIRSSKARRVMLALGFVAHRAILLALELRPSAYRFSHGARHVLPDGSVLYDSYHCSRYNTQTRRLDSESFAAVFGCIRAELGVAARVRPGAR